MDVVLLKEDGCNKMAVYHGPKCKIERREGKDLSFKSGVRSRDTKCKTETPPGMHVGRRSRLSDYGVHLRMKQMIKRFYGLLERQFRKYYHLAALQKGSTGENLLLLLERRLDNVVYRSGFASTRSEARQLVSHKSILVNGCLVNIPSYLVSPGDEIEVREKAKKQDRILAALDLTEQRADCDWLDVNKKLMKAVYKSHPQRADLPPDFNENLVVEFYSK